MWKVRITKIESTVTAQALTIGETPEIIEKNRLGARLHDFLGIPKRAKGNNQNLRKEKKISRYSND
jgi:hypothetical protein